MKKTILVLDLILLTIMELSCLIYSIINQNFMDLIFISGLLIIMTFCLCNKKTEKESNKISKKTIIEHLVIYLFIIMFLIYQIPSFFIELNWTIYKNILTICILVIILYELLDMVLFEKLEKKKRIKKLMGDANNNKSNI